VPEDKAQTSFTDPELKIMPQSNKGFAYGGNAQVVVEDACQIIVACDVVLQTNDKQQAVPLARLALADLEAAGSERPVAEAGRVRKVVNAADTGYFSAGAVSGLEALDLDLYLATGRQKHHGAAACLTHNLDTAEVPMAQQALADLEAAGIERPVDAAAAAGLPAQEKSRTLARGGR
jgi:hypothetical protein